MYNLHISFFWGKAPGAFISLSKETVTQISSKTIILERWRGQQFPEAPCEAPFLLPNKATLVSICFILTVKQRSEMVLSALHRDPGALKEMRNWRHKGSKRVIYPYCRQSQGSISSTCDWHLYSLAKTCCLLNPPPTESCNPVVQRMCFPWRKRHGVKGGKEGARDINLDTVHFSLRGKKPKNPDQWEILHLKF